MISFLKNNFIVSILLVMIFVSCKQSDPPSLDPVSTPISATYTSTINFSGITWNIKTGNNNKLGPGPNYFSNSSNNVFLDSLGYLHLKITNENGKWNCAEIISNNYYGYGTYAFTIASNVANIDKNVVVGCFTWDNTSFYSQANSEIDIEFSKWGSTNDTLTLTYSAQPVSFSYPTIFYERTKHPIMNVSKLKTLSTHAFKWTDSLVTWASYAGPNYPGSTTLASWQFDKSNLPRIKVEGGNQSAPVIIPAPGIDTHARINLWLLNGAPPSNNNEVELIVKEFRFIPL
jgi:hypothetical protein